MTMKTVHPLLLMTTALILSSSCGSNKTTKSKPNIIYILADDLGYGELGCYGQQIIETPHIDALAANGMKFTQHYSGAPVCAPARCILLTGKHAGHAYIRGNHEWKERGDVWSYDSMINNPKLEGQWPIPDSIYTVGEMLQEIGYTTGMVGKWGLGAPETEGIPNKQGFDFFYGYNCQRQAHTLYPMHLWKDQEKVILNNKSVAPRSNLEEGADPHDPESYADFELNDYAPTLMHDEALAFLDREKDGPFFLYYASPLPHVPLQAPKKWVEYYQDKLGPEEPYTGKSYFPSFAPRATYAAMISYLDEQVGDLVAKLKEIGQYENTLIIFTSDNGPTYAGGADTAFFESANPFENIQEKIKGQVNEGGIRVPMIAAWPGKIEPRSKSAHISAFHDVMPTLAELTESTVPSSSNGLSFLATLLGESQTVHDYLYWEFPAYTGQQAIRQGKWKAIRKGIFKNEMGIELYDIESDPQELENVASIHPDLVAEMEKLMSSARVEPDIERFKMPALGDVKTAE